jgi:hypothetical protein
VAQTSWSAEPPSQSVIAATNRRPSPTPNRKPRRFQQRLAGRILESSLP